MVFPIASALGIVLITIGGVVVWGERLRKLQVAGIAAAVLAVVLINLK